MKKQQTTLLGIPLMTSNFTKTGSLVLIILMNISLLAQTNLDSPNSSDEYLINSSFTQGLEGWNHNFGELMEEDSGSVTLRQFKIAQDVDYIKAGTRFKLYVKYEIPYSQIGALGYLKIGFNYPEIVVHVDKKSVGQGIYEVELEGVASEEYCQFFIANTVFGVHIKLDLQQKVRQFF